MLRLFLVIAATLAAAVPALAEDLGWQTYANPRFGYSVDVPVGYLLPQPGPDNGDGQTFASADGRAYLAV
ncbi:MAG: hypothetical protein KDJ41_14280, partial [Hyphomicrobiaceae bacterium]|nr:hypothetical protein [Hyphomicrobiaceae bacterium]